MSEATSEDVAVVLAELLHLAEQLLLIKRFGIEAAKGLMTSLWASYDQTRCAGASEQDLTCKVISKACWIAENYFAELQKGRQVYDVNQVRLFLCWAVTAFPSEITVVTVVTDAFRGVTFIHQFLRNGKDISGSELFLKREPFQRFSSLIETVLSYSFDMGAVDSDHNEEFDALLDFIAWIERQRPAATLYVVSKMPWHKMNEHFLYRTVIQRCSCLLHLGFEECARSLFKLELPQSGDMASQTDARQGYVHAQLLYREDYYRKAQDIAKYALLQSEEDEEKREIEELLRHICAAIGIDQQEWLEGTHVHQTEKLAVKQNECQQRHVKQPRHRRPKCRQPTKLEPKASARMVDGKPVDTVKQKENAKQLPVSSPNTSWEQSISCTIPTVSKSSSTAGNRNSTRNTMFAKISLSDGLESEEDDIEDKGYDLETKCFNFTQHDFAQEGVTGDTDWVGNVEETSLILPSGTSDEEAQGWFQRSVQIGASAQQRYIHISPKQLEQYERPGKRKSRYTDLEKDVPTLKALMADCPGKYKRCHLQIKSSHHAVAYVVGKHDSCTEIQIDGRSRIGRTFMDDEVVVEVLAEPKTRQDQNDIRSMTQASVDKNTHGKVVGLLQTNRFSDVQHPELFCTLDDHETHLMWPLCKTVPKIHVLHDGVKKKFPREPNNYVEIFQITADGYLDHREFFKLNKSKMHQYVFRVVFITWRSNTSVYPLGAVFGVHFAGRDYAGGLELLAMQHRLPNLYPPDAVAQTHQLLQEENLPAEDRKDLRKKRIFTVDPKGARELDDAISIWREGVYFIVGVHITDVAAVVPPGEGVDLEARRRGVTFYPHLCKPHTMLPEDLGEKRCSLLPGQERLAFSFFFKFSQKGTQIGDPEVERSLIKSVKQLTYADAQTILDGKSCNHISKEFHGDIHQLHRITSMLKENRQKHSKFFVPFEDPRLPDLKQIADHVQAHSLIQELMILTNTFVAKKLRSRFLSEMLLRCHQACSMEELTKWMEKEGSLCHLVMQLQGNHVTRETSLSVENSRNQARKQEITVMTNVWKRLCRLLEDGQIAEARRLAFTDGIHPLQHLTASHWMEMMKRAEYKCSHGLNGPDHRHFGLNQDVYTHFTSPMRRYADLHVQRLLHNDLDGKPAYCTTEEVTDLCRQLNSAKQRQAAFAKGCQALKVADDLQRQPLVFRAFVNTMDTEKMTVCIPSLIKIPDHKMEIPFSVLRICSQPDFSTDTALKQDSVCLMWLKRHFDNRGTCPPGDLIPMWKHIGRKSDSKVISVDMTINPDQLTVPVNQKDWIGIVKALISEEINMSVPEQAKRSKAESMQVNYVSSEKGDGTVCLRPVRFKRVYKPGQVIQLQLSAEPHKGVLKLQVELVELARNASICTKHTRNPVQALTAPATRTTRDQQFTSSDEYLQAWMPLLEMEAAAGAGDTDSAVTIDFVKVSMTTDKIGYFCLSAKFCAERCISIGGKPPDSIRAEDTKQKVLFPLDYLCLRLRQECPAPMVSRIHQSLVREAVDSHFTWLAHACVLAVTRKGSQSDDGAHLKVNFILSPSSPKNPDQLMDKEGARVTVEILTKSEVERRAQEMLLQLEEDGCYLSRSIAYGSDIPKLDEDHYKMAQKPDYHDVKIKSVPSNNKRQGEAIRQALTSSLLLIQGPPGTGKTYTGIKLIYLFSQINRQLMAEGKGKKSILFCGPSNKSVDHVAGLLKEELGDDHCPKMVRVYSSAIEMKDFPVPRGDLRSRRVMQDLNSEHTLKRISLHHLIRENGKMYADDITKLEKEFAKSLRNPDKFPVNNNQLKTYRTLLFKASVEELKHHEVILTTCAVAGSQRLIEGTRGRVFQVIIDECAMCSEPQAMIPIVATKAKQVVLIGDHKQLRPVITCQAAADLGLDQSLFERLFDRFGNNAVFLNKQYRMHPQLCTFPSHEFYAGTLRTGLSFSWTEEPLPFWPPNPDYQPPNPDDQSVTENIMGDPANMAIPHLFVDVRGDEETLTVTTDEGNERSKSNALEIEKVIEILGFLKERFGVQTEFVRILTQYNAQRNELSKAITKKCDDRSQLVFTRYDKGLFGVSTVVSSQGEEWDYVILSTVRSLPSYKIEPHPTLGWNRQNLGFITDSNQVNVALTRAKKGLFIVGNAELLRCDPVWKDLLDMYWKKGCVVSAEKFPPPPPARAHHPRRRNHHSASENWEEV